MTRLALVRSGEAAAPPAEALAEARGLAAGYGREPAIHGIDLVVRAGMRVGVLGPNGGGKTTLFRALLGELAPMAGSVVLHARCGVVPQGERARLDYPVSALDVALMGALSRLPWWRPPGRAGKRDARAALARVGLAERADTPFGELSGGQRQRVLIARALVQEARLLLLDEPFAGLDAPSVRLLGELMGELCAGGRGIVVSSHDLEQVRSCDMVLCLNRRPVAFARPEEALRVEVLEATYRASS